MATRSGDLTLNNQEGIDTFSYRVISGNLNIQEIIGGNIMNLDSLESLIAIGGNLNISSNPSLMSLSGLDSLTELGGDLNILFNSSLTSLRGFSSLTEIGGYLYIESNGSLASLSGLGSLTEIGGYLTIQFNGSLTSLRGLDSLTEIGGYVTIQSNDSLTSLRGFSSLTEIGGYLSIFSNASFTSLRGLGSLTEIGGFLSIFNNAFLTNFCTISSLIGDDKQITSREYSVTTNGYNPPYALVGNENFCSNADGRIFEGNLRLNSQDSIDAFNYSRVIGNLTINDSLDGNITNLSGLSELIQVEGILQIDSNSSLTSLSGLESLTEIGIYLTINDNDSLGSLSGLESLHSTGDTLIVTGNRDLTNFCTISPLIGIVNQITTIAYIVSGNDYNPLYREIQTTTRCSLDQPEVHIALPDVFIQPGDAFDPINLGSSFSDPNRYPLTYTATSSDETAITVSINKSILTLVEVNGEGTATITVTATNDSVLSVSDEFAVFINTNMPPTVANALIDVETVSGTAFAPIDISSVFSDPDGDDDALTYTVATSDAAIVTATLNGTTLILTETGKGTAIITVTATDALGLPFDDTFEVIITNTAPEIVADQLLTAFTQPGTPFPPIDLSAAFRDANGDELTYTATSSDENVVTVSVSGTMLTLTEVGGVGTAMITVTATDGEASVSDEFMAIISENNAPIRNTAITFPPIPTVEVGYQLTPAVNLVPFFSDPDGDALTYTATTGDVSIATVEIVQTSSVTFTAIGVGTTTLTVTATDPEGFFVSESVTITVESGVLGIAETDILVIYPNPSSGVFELSRRATMVRVYDMNGRLVYRVWQTPNN